MKSSLKAAALAASTLVFTWSAASQADHNGRARTGGAAAGTTPQGPQQDPSSLPPDVMTDADPDATTTTTTTGTTTQPGTTTTTQGAYAPTGPGAEQREEIRPNPRVLIPSAGVFLGSYATSAIVGAVNDRDSDQNLLIPVVGPWIDLANRDCDNPIPCKNEGGSVALLIASGVLQAAGVAGVVASFFIPETTSRRMASAPAKPRVNVTPLSIGRGGAGLGAVGTF